MLQHMAVRETGSELSRTAYVNYDRVNGEDSTFYFDSYFAARLETTSGEPMHFRNAGG